jgi:membrane protease YdiL (CAAX protease family)
MEYSKKIRTLDLVVVLALTIVPSILRSGYYFFNEVGKYTEAQKEYAFFYALTGHVLALLLLFYVLLIRNKSYKDLGIVISWNEIGIGLLLWLLVTIIFSVIELELKKVVPASIITPKNLSVLLPTQFSFIYLLFLIINPFFEELIVRGFTMTEVFALASSKVLAVIISIALQISYHLYQGIVPALLLGLIFLCYSLFYVKTGKLTPVIVAHLIADLLLLIRLK